MRSSSKSLKAAKNRGISNAAMSLKSCVGRTQSQPIVMRCRGSNSCLAAAKSSNALSPALTATHCGAEELKINPARAGGDEDGRNHDGGGRNHSGATLGAPSPDARKLK